MDKDHLNNLSKELNIKSNKLKEKEKDLDIKFDNLMLKEAELMAGREQINKVLVNLKK